MNHSPSSWAPPDWSQKGATVACFMTEWRKKNFIMHWDYGKHKKPCSALFYVRHSSMISFLIYTRNSVRARDKIFLRSWAWICVFGSQFSCRLFSVRFFMFASRTQRNSHTLTFINVWTTRTSRSASRNSFSGRVAVSTGKVRSLDQGAPMPWRVSEPFRHIKTCSRPTNSGYNLQPHLIYDFTTFIFISYFSAGDKLL